jgi:hypothetical protein
VPRAGHVNRQNPTVATPPPGKQDYRAREHLTEADVPTNRPRNWTSNPGGHGGNFLGQEGWRAAVPILSARGTLADAHQSKCQRCVSGPDHPRRWAGTSQGDDGFARHFCPIVEIPAAYCVGGAFAHAGKNMLDSRYVLWPIRWDTKAIKYNDCIGRSVSHFSAKSLISLAEGSPAGTPMQSCANPEFPVSTRRDSADGWHTRPGEFEPRAVTTAAPLRHQAGGAGSRRSAPPHYRSVRGRMPVLSVIIFVAVITRAGSGNYRRWGLQHRLIMVWLQVRVLPGPPMQSCANPEFPVSTRRDSADGWHTRPGKFDPSQIQTALGRIRGR